MTDRTIAIGDIHGCSIALETLLDVIQPRPNDLIIQLGDVIDRGPNSSKVVEQLIALDGKCQFEMILGNHEEMFLNELSDKKEIERWLKNGGIQTLHSYGWKPGKRTNLASVFPDHHLNFIRNAKPYFETDDAIFVHAGYESQLPLSEQPDLALRWRVLSRNNVQPHFSMKTVFVGHTAQLSGNVLDLGFVKGIDTNCHRGGWLTAFEVHSGQVWQANDGGEIRC